MNRAYLLLLIQLFIILIVHLTAGDAYSSGIKPQFSSSEEYLLHTKGSSTCATSECHSALTDAAEYVHNPVASGMCSECHSAEAYPGKFGLEPDQRVMCNRCHKSMGNEIQSNKYVHGPIINGDCTSCHDPHLSNRPFLLRQSYNELCITCHKLDRFYDGDFVHKPVKDGNCGLCHDPHASNIKARLIDAGSNLCIVCHEDFITGMTASYVHEPIIKTGCSSCHDPHSGNNELRLIKDANELCFSCHDEKQSEVRQYTKKHEPAYEGQCTACHSPHFSERKALLKDELNVLCFNCHKDNSIWMKRKYKHGPVVQGNCSACHNPHGSDNAFILKLPFPHSFYSEYEEGKYGLCFLCHTELLITAESANAITHFRNGEVNLHKLHVMQKKGRTCRACHDVHASEQEGRIRDSFPFGTMEMQLQFNKTEKGGTCLPGCHKVRRYDRDEKVENQ